MQALDSKQLLTLYRAMVTARQIDKLEQELTSRGEAFFHVSGAGHEGTAVLASLLHGEDWLSCHYRDKALMIARGVGPRVFFDGLYNKQRSQTRGRQMCAHAFSDRKLKIMSAPTPVGNGALHAVGVASVIKAQSTSPLVLYSLGDGSTQEGEVLEACAEAARQQLPVLFLVQDNHWAISTATKGRTFYSHPEGEADSFCGIPITRVDGRHVVTAWQRIREVVGTIRQQRKSHVVIFDVERLASHTNADDETIYREAEEIQRVNETSDPIRNLEKHLLSSVCDEQELERIRGEVAEAVAEAEAASYAGPDPVAVQDAKPPIKVELTHPSRERHGVAGEPRFTMREAMRSVLEHHLLTDPDVVLLGEDIEDPKGDVFGVTRGLSTRFPSRVRNSALSESTIVGTSIGQAMAGRHPVAFIQFADFLPVAFNQITCELGNIHWRTDGHWQAPVILMVACGAYRPGLGPFHAATHEAIMTHTPGVDVYMPSNAGDAAGLLNAAFAARRPAIFFYPKTLLNDPEETTPSDVERQFTPIGIARRLSSGHDITFVAWGNTVRICQKAADTLETIGVGSDVLDLRTLSPCDQRTVLASAEQTARLVVVHEDNHTCGLGAEVLATVAEQTRVPVAMRRVTRPDTYIPCNFENQVDVLPSFKRVLTTAAELLDLELKWERNEQPRDGLSLIEAVGSGPADETVIISELFVQAGQSVERGEVVAALEATKSVFELTSPVTGVIEEICAAEGDTVSVGAPLAKVRAADAGQRPRPVVQENPGKPLLRRQKSRDTLHLPRHDSRPRAFGVGISSIATVTGSRRVGNSELAKRSHGMTPADIVRRTGIEERHWVNSQEDAISMAVKACWKVLDQEDLIVDDLDLVICSTTSPTSVTPSMACRLLNGLTSRKSDTMLQAFDINAACSGYLYALQSGYDFLQSRPDGRVLVVTAEVLSPLLDLDDFETVILFGDATSATVLYGENHFDRALARLIRPELSAKGEDGSSLSVPFRHGGVIQMKGSKVFSEAVRTMVTSLNSVCQREQLAIDDLNLVVPHQANQRIIDAIQHRVGIDVYSNIRHHGNTSSSSIPLCLNDVLPNITSGHRLGLCAFGGGFTFGAGILQAN
ncbi:MAG: beta-ketoacyl-ACP synthase 3 [Pirellulaceae bacterium]